MINEPTNDFPKKNILICDTQPVAVEGMKWLIENSGDLQFAGSVLTLDAVFEVLNPEAAKLAALEAARLAAVELETASVEEILEGHVPESDVFDAEANVSSAVEDSTGYCLDAEALDTEALRLEGLIGSIPEAVVWGLAQTEDCPVDSAPEPESLVTAGPIDAVVIDKGLGLPAVMDLLQKLTATSHPTPAVVWGASVTESEALRLLQAGAKGILRRTSESGTLLTCLRAVTAGGTWMEDGIFGSADKLYNPRRSQLRNRDIAKLLGIRIGTVKIHLKHIFEKTGVSGRYGLAFTGLQNKGHIPPSVTPNLAA